jgi:hypothetical protein
MKRQKEEAAKPSLDKMPHCHATATDTGLKDDSKFIASSTLF